MRADAAGPLKGGAGPDACWSAHEAWRLGQRDLRSVPPRERGYDGAMWASTSGSRVRPLVRMVFRLVSALAVAACGVGCFAESSASNDGGDGATNATNEAASSALSCSGTVSGAFTGVFSCTVSLVEGGSHETVQLGLLKAQCSVYNLSIALRPAVGASFAPGSYDAVSLTPDSYVLVSDSCPGAPAYDYRYPTNGGTPVPGASILLVLTALDPPPSSPSGILDPASETHGTLDAVMPRSDLMGSMAMLHVTF